MNRPVTASAPGAAARGFSALGAGASSVVTALGSAPEHVAAVFRHRYPTVAVTGMTGTGKTCLVDRLARRAQYEADSEVGSATMERRTRRMARGHGFRFRVVPGNNAATRLWALDEVFHDDPVDGVLHVVSFGHATARRTAGITGEAETTRSRQLRLELDDWAITAHRIAGMAVRRDRPVWLIIAVTKTDLFPDEVADALAYYSPGGGSPFAAKLDELRALAGGARISVDVLATSVPTGDSAAGKAASQGQIEALERRLTQLSGHV